MVTDTYSQGEGKRNSKLLSFPPLPRSTMLNVNNNANHSKFNLGICFFSAVLYLAVTD